MGGLTYISDDGTGQATASPKKLDATNIALAGAVLILKGRARQIAAGALLARILLKSRHMKSPLAAGALWARILLK